MEAATSDVLVIDDEPLLRDSIVAYLEDSDFTVVSAQNGEEGLEKFTALKPSLILCDLRMPEMDGLSVLRRVRELDQNIPFIVVSGAGVMDDVVKALKLGATDYFTKPIMSLESLEHVIRKNLQHQALAKENQQNREELEKANKELAESVELLKADLQAGKEVQLRMLPKKEMTLKGYRFQHHIHPSLYLSGDFCDYFSINDHRIGFYIADVSGHGASSAFVTVLLKNLMQRMRRNIRRGSSDEMSDPSRVLERVNNELIDSKLGKHMTLFFGLIDTKTNQLEYSVGAQLPSPIFFDGASCRLMTEAKGPAVGLFRDAQFPRNKLDLSKGCELTLFSDGVLDLLEGETIETKESQLNRVCEQSTGDDAIDHLVKQLAFEDDQETADDVTILRVSRIE